MTPYELMCQLIIYHMHILDMYIQRCAVYDRKVNVLPGSHIYNTFDIDQTKQPDTSIEQYSNLISLLIETWKKKNHNYKLLPVDDTAEDDTGDDHEWKYVDSVSKQERYCAIQTVSLLSVV